MWSSWIGFARPSAAVLLCLVVAQTLGVGGCKKTTAVEAAAAQAVEEAAQRPTVENEADLTAIGLPVYPGARRLDSGVRVELLEGSAYGQQMIFRTSASLDDVVAFYARQLPDPEVTESRTGTGRTVTLRSGSSTKEARSSHFVVVSETPQGVQILLAVDSHKARFAVFLKSISPGAEEQVVQAIVDWKSDPNAETPPDAAAIEVAKEEARKLLPVLPRPVDVELDYEKAQELREALVRAGGDAEIVPAPDTESAYRGAGPEWLSSSKWSPTAEKLNESAATESADPNADGAKVTEQGE